MKETTEEKLLPSPHLQAVSALGKQPEGFFFISVYVTASASHAPWAMSRLCLKEFGQHLGIHLMKD